LTWTYLLREHTQLLKPLREKKQPKLPECNLNNAALRVDKFRQDGVRVCHSSLHRIEQAEREFYARSLIPVFAHRIRNSSPWDREFRFAILLAAPFVWSISYHIYGNRNRCIPFQVFTLMTILLQFNCFACTYLA